MVVHARFDGRVLIPVEPVLLPTDRLLELDVKDIEEPSPGTGVAILEILKSLPPVDPLAVDEMMAAIDAARQPVDYKGAFDDELGSNE